MRLGLAWIIVLFIIMGACSSGDPLKEINHLVSQNEVLKAKKLFKEMVEKESNPSLERQYIEFLWEHRQYRDFIKATEVYLRENPQDAEIKHLEFEYYAKLASDAEKREDFSGAMDYIITKLLSTDYKNYRKWESRQTTVLRKWYQYAKDREDVSLQKNVLNQIKNLGFENLAVSLDKEMYESISKADEERQ